MRTKKPQACDTDMSSGDFLRSSYNGRMKKTLSPFLIVLSLSISLSLLSGCASLMSSVEPPEVSVINIEPLPADGLFEQRVRLDLRVINPNDFDLGISGFSFKLDVNDTRFARGVSNDAIRVPRLGEAKTSVVVSSTMLDVFRQVAGLAGRETMGYEISGKVYFSNPGVRSVSFSHKADLGSQR